jgi:hypothetical protein
MYQRTIRYAPVFLSLAVLTLVGCESGGDTPTAPASRGLQASITAEPLSARPEFLPVVCQGLPAFGVRVIINLRGPDVVLSGLRFQFIDLVGTRTLPEVIRLPTPSSSVSSIPTTTPVTLPGIAALPPLPTSTTIPFFARFGCGIRPEGTLIVTGDLNGTTEQMKVMITDH